MANRTPCTVRWTRTSRAVPGSAAMSGRVAGLVALTLAAAGLGGCASHAETPNTHFFRGADEVGDLQEQGDFMRERLLRQFPLGSQGDAGLIAYLKSQGFKVERTHVPGNREHPVLGEAEHFYGPFLIPVKTGVMWRLDQQGRLSEVVVNHGPDF